MPAASQGDICQGHLSLRAGGLWYKLGNISFYRDQPAERMKIYAMSDQTVSLQAIHPGQSATIVHVGGVGALRRRFAEMGIVAGEVIRAERVAPLGDPVAYRIKGYRLSLRREEAAQISVRVEGLQPHA